MNNPDHCQGIALADLAAEFGTPLYIYDAEVLRSQYLGLRDRLPGAMEVYYSLKANPSLAVAQVFRELGAGAELSSLAELACAQRAGYPAGRTVFLGPGKSREEIAACLKAGVTLVVESLPELAAVDDLAGGLGARAEVLVRVNPDFALKGGGLTMGGKPRQFGIDAEILLDLQPRHLRYPHLAVRGVHAYLGTRILSADSIVANTERILALAERLAGHLDLELATVDVGGGLGVAYHDKEDDLDIEALGAGIHPVVARFRADHPGTRLIMESGRYLAAAAGTYLTRVCYTKKSRGERFAVCDGGTNHHMAAVGIGSAFRRNFPVRRVGAGPAGQLPWNVTGPLCTPNDTLGRAVALPADLAPGDLIAVARSGAYGPTASPVLFLSHGHPAEVVVQDGTPHLARPRDTVDDLLGCQIALGRSSA